MADPHDGMYTDVRTKALLARSAAALRWSAEIAAQLDALTRHLLDVIRRSDEAMARIHAVDAAYEEGVRSTAFVVPSNPLRNALAQIHSTQHRLTIDRDQDVRDRRRRPHRGPDRRVATRVLGVWTEDERQRRVAERASGCAELTISDRRRSPRRGKERRDLATRVPGVWTDDERGRFIVDRDRYRMEVPNDDPRRI